MHIQIVLFDGFDLLDAIAPYEVLEAGVALAAKNGIHTTLEFVSAEGPRQVRSGAEVNPAHGTLIATNAQLDVNKADIVIVPGALGDYDGEGPNSIPAILGRAAQSELATLLSQALHKPKLTVVTVCGGSLVLGLAGLIQGRNAVTHHMGLDVLAATGVNVVRARVVDDGDLISGGGVTSGLDVGFYVLERFFGCEIALSVEKLFEYERRGVTWRKPLEVEAA